MVAHNAVFDRKLGRLGSVVAEELLNIGFLTQRPKKCIIVVWKWR